MKGLSPLREIPELTRVWRVGNSENCNITGGRWLHIRVDRFDSGAGILGSHVPRLAGLPCKEIVVSSILIGSTVGLSKNHEVIAATMRNDSRGKQEVRFAGWMYADGVMVAYR